MIWIISKSIVRSEKELENRRQYIKDVTKAEVSLWALSKCKSRRLFSPEIEFFQCISKKGEYGVVITAHIQEVADILNAVLSRKAAKVIINSCAIRKDLQTAILELVKNKNGCSEVFFAKQEHTSEGYELNFTDDVGRFGFSTTESERELFQHRKLGMMQALRKAFKKVPE